MLDLRPDGGVAVHAEHDEVARAGEVQGAAGRLDLVQHGLHRLDPPAAAAAPSATSDAVSPAVRPRSRASSRTTMMSKCWAATSPSSRMSSSRRSPAVAITPIRRCRSRSSGGVLAQLVDEVAEQPHAGRVVGVVDDHGDAVDLGDVEAARREVVRGGEGAQALPDVVQRGAGGEGGPGRGHRVLHVHQRLAAEGGGQQVRPGQLHRPAAVPDHDHVAELAVLEHHGAPAAAAVVVDRPAGGAAGLGHGEPDHLAASRTRVIFGDQRVVGVEHREARRGAPPRR